MLAKTKYAQLAAVAAMAVMLGTGASLTAARAQGGQTPQMEKQEGQTTVRSGSDRRRDAGSKPDNRSGRDMRSDRSRSTVTTSTTVRDRDRDRDRVTFRDRDRDRDRDHWRWRGRESFGASFIILGPRVVYRTYGSGWCRALHSGRHWAPRIGWHRGRHVGAVRCG